MAGDENDLKSELSIDVTDFKTGMAQANRELRVLDSAFKAGVATLGDWSKSSEGLGQRISTLNQSIDVQSRKVSSLQEEYTRVAAEKGATSRAAQELEIQLNKETAKLGDMTRELGTTEEALGKMGDESDDTAKETKKVGDESDKAEKKVKTFGEQLKDLGKGVGNVLAGVGKTIAAVGAAAVGAVGGLTAIAMKSSEAAGELVDMSAKTGLSLTTLQELQYIGGQVGVGIDTITGSLARFTNAIEGSASGTGQQAEDMAKLGVSVLDANGQLRDSRDVYFEAIQALGQMENATDREITAQNLFGKSYQELMPLIRASKEELAAMTEEAHKNGAVMSEEAVMGLEAWGDEIAGLKGSVQGLMGTFSATLMPTFRGVTGMAKGWMGELAGIMSGSNGDLASIAPQLGGFLGGVFADIGSKAPGMIEMGLGLVLGLVSALLSAMPTLIPAATEIVRTLVEGIGDMATMLLEAAPELIMQLVNGLIRMLPDLIETGTKVVMALIQGIATLLPRLIPAAVQMIVMLINGIAQALPQMMTMIAEIIPQVVITLIENLPLLIEAALGLIVALVDGLIQSLPVLIGYVPEIIIAIVGALIQALPMILSSGKQIIESLLNGIKSLFGSLRTGGSDAIKAVIDGIKSLFSTLYTNGADLISKVIAGVKSSFGQLWNLGRDIVLGIWEGIKQKWEDLKTWFKGLFRGLINDTANDQEVNSPSRLWARRIGGPIAEGIGVGFLREMDKVERQMRTTMAGLVPAMDVGISGLGLQPVYAGVGQTSVVERPVTINVNPSEPIDYELLANKVARKVTEGW